MDSLHSIFALQNPAPSNATEAAVGKRRRLKYFVNGTDLDILPPSMYSFLPMRRREIRERRGRERGVGGRKAGDVRQAIGGSCAIARAGVVGRGEGGTHIRVGVRGRRTRRR